VGATTPPPFYPGGPLAVRRNASDNPGELLTPDPPRIPRVTRERPSLGEEATVDVTVTDEMLVDILGRRIHPVYATAWMVKHMEEAGRLLVEPHLGDGEDATGYAISVVHERPARAGDRIQVTARATRVDDRECEAVVEARGPSGLVGRGTLVQRYIEKGRFR
jgi:fluoroacetyl-CoA thioesterase